MGSRSDDRASVLHSKVQLLPVPTYAATRGIQVAYLIAVHTSTRRPLIYEHSSDSIATRTPGPKTS